MPAKTTTTPPDPLTMTTAEVNAIVTDAQTEASETATAVQEAERALRGEIPGGEDITPGKLSALRQAAEYAALKVPAAERQHAEIQQARMDARRAEIREKILTEAADGLNGADGITAALDAFESALNGLCEAVQAHNGRVAHWDRQMSAAGIPQIHGEGRGPGALSHTFRGESVTIGHKVYRPMRAGTLLGATLYRVLEQYPRDFRKYSGDIELTERGDLVDSKGPVDLHALIRRDA
ncbi:hypothetical protein ACWF94_12160 [Streptomyces sp. NPDC055078]